MLFQRQSHSAICTSQSFPKINQICAFFPKRKNCRAYNLSFHISKPSHVSNVVGTPTSRCRGAGPDKAWLGCKVVKRSHLLMCSLYVLFATSLADPPGRIRQQTGSSSDIMGSCATAAVGSSVDRTTNEASKSCANEQNVAWSERPKRVFSRANRHQENCGTKIQFKLQYLNLSGQDPSYARIVIYLLHRQSKTIFLDLKSSQSPCAMNPNTVPWCTMDMRQCSGCVPSQRKH